MILTEGYLVYKYYWPEWASDTNRMKYIAATVGAYGISDLFTYDIIYAQVMSELTPRHPDLGIDTIKEAIPRLRAGHGPIPLNQLLGYMGIFFFFASAFYTVFIKKVSKIQRKTERKVEE